MKDLTPELHPKLLEQLQAVTCWSKILVIGMDNNHENIIDCWLDLRAKHASWSCRTVDEEVAQKFGVTDRTVRRIRREMSQMSQQPLDNH